MSEHRLALIRHGSAADGPSDRERPLTPRGIADATALGVWLAEHGIRPDRVIVSPALRAVQTWHQAAAAVGVPRVDDDERIYQNTVDDVLAAIRETSDGIGILAVVGHNPSMETLARQLDDDTGPAAVRDRLAAGLPAGGVAVFDVNQPWSAVAVGTAVLTDFTAPAR